ncbi:hypothetical protein ACFL0S_05295 [Thermodesulfobacteriota bacterium]
MSVSTGISMDIGDTEESSNRRSRRMDVKRIKNKLSRMLRSQPPEEQSTSDEPVVYLHIGMPKTGTTAIQRFLFENHSVLLDKQGCLYPDHSLGWHQHVSLVKAIVRPIFPKAIFNKAIAEIEEKDWLEGLKRQYVGKNCSKIIVSSEFLWASPAMQTHLKFHGDTDENFALIEEVVAKVKDTFSSFSKVNIIVYLRRQDTWLESFFNQQIKAGAMIPPEDAVLEVKNYLLYAKNLKIWRKYFGAENVIVQFYEQAVDIVGHFCEITGLDTSGFNVQRSDKSEVVNPSLSPRAIKIMRTAIEKQLDKDLLERLRVVFMQTSAATMPGIRPQYNVFSRDFHDKVLSKYEEDTMELVSMYPEAAIYLERTDAEEETPPAEVDANRWEIQVELLLEELIEAK